MLNLDRAQGLREACNPGVERVFQQGKFVVVKIRGDGNCFFVSSTTGVLLWAVHQSGPTAIRDIHARFAEALGGAGLNAYSALPGDLKVMIAFYFALLDCFRDTGAESIGVSVSSMFWSRLVSIGKRDEGWW